MTIYCAAACRRDAYFRAGVHDAPNESECETQFRSDEYPLTSDGPLGSHVTALATWSDFRMDFCDLIVSMEQAEISPRPVVGAIFVVSGLAVSFLLWLLYVHHASADFAGRWMFLPALNALLNGLCAIALCVGLYFIKHHNREVHRTSMLLAFAFSSVFLISYIVNHALHGDTIFPGYGSDRTLDVPHLALCFDHRRGGFRVPQGVCVLDSVLIQPNLRE